MNLFKLREAVLKNTCRPTDEEAKELADKSLRTSRYWEGDSEMGLILFIGIASNYGYSSTEIEMVISVDFEQVQFKRSVYDRAMNSSVATLSALRMRNKTKLIKNYLRYHDLAFQG